jgi:glucose-1-phosphate adenylyltransferase
MQDTTVSDNTHLEYVITDKNVLVKNARTLIGCDTYPIYIAKGNTV